MHEFCVAVQYLLYKHNYKFVYRKLTGKVETKQDCKQLTLRRFQRVPLA